MKWSSRIIIFMISFLLTWGGWTVLRSLFFQERLNFFPSKSEAILRKVNKTKEEWKKILSAEQFHVMFEKGTEPAFHGQYHDFWEKGYYLCAACGAVLFSSEDKYDHGTGWPSFKASFSEANLEYAHDYSLGWPRLEVRCSSCRAHLGHLFFDGPEPTGRHYCLNSIALNFMPEAEARENLPKRATFAGGCFWGMQYKFSQLEGVLNTAVGYSGGDLKNPSYEQVGSGKTGHAESVEIVYDPKKISYEELVRKFFSFHDPTQLNRQGPDIGSQYRSVIFYRDEKQQQTAFAIKEEIEKSGAYGHRKIVTEIIPYKEFFRAEEYHQNYFLKNNKNFK